MVKYLVIVESPNKISKVSQYLNSIPGNDTYLVKATGGHIMNLNPKKLSIDIENNFEPEYQWQEDAYHKKVIKELKKAYEECNSVLIASDYDLEGENIGYSICHLLNIPIETTPRLIFHKITKKALQDAIKNPSFLQPNLLDAQKSRRVLDRLIGYRISPVTRKVKTGLSVGRVQSIALKLVVDREKEIEKFQTAQQFKVEAIFDAANKDVKNIYTTLNVNFQTKDDTTKFLTDCQPASFQIGDYKKKLELRHPGAPFISASLQSECSRKFNISTKKVSEIAQKLYEKGLISYPRTDSPQVPEEVLAELKGYIVEKYGEKYYQHRQFKAKGKNAQEAHSCIYPTQIKTASIIDEDQLQVKIYQIIHRRTVACQMAPSKIRATEILIDISTRDKEKFKGRAEEEIFDGWKKVYQYQDHSASKDNKDKEEEAAKMKNNDFKDLADNDILLYQSMTARENYTNPKTRYDQASLVKAMEKLGVGRPSTYPTIMETIEKRNYVVKETRKGNKKNLSTLKMTPKQDGTHAIKETTKQQLIGTVRNKYFPTDIGLSLDEFIREHFENVFNYQFTAEMESDMKDIESGDLVWHEVVKKYYESFQPIVDNLQKNLPAFTSPGKSLDEKRLVGTMSDGREAYAYITKHGPAVQLLTLDEKEKMLAGEKVKGKFVNLDGKNLIEKVTVADIEKLMQIPKTLGQIDSKDVILKKGTYGLYLNYDGKNFSCPKKLIDSSESDTEGSNEEKNEKDENRTIEEDEIGKLSWEKVESYLKEEIEKKEKKMIKTIPNGKGEPIKVMNGDYGPFFIFKKKIVGVPKTVKPEDLTKEICEALFEQKKQSQQTKKKSFPKKK